MDSVSVIIPCFNRTRFLKSAIASVFAQTHANWDMIIADDGSGAETRQYLRSIKHPRSRVLWLEHSGNPASVRNAATAIASGRYLAFLDSDDEWVPAKLEKQLLALRGRRECRWSYSACHHVDESGVVLAKRSSTAAAPEGWIFEDLLRLRIGIAMPTVLTERSLFLEAGGFDESQKFAEFHDLCLRLALKAQVAVVREPLSSVRRHDEHYSADRVADHSGWAQLYRKMAATLQSPALQVVCRRMQADISLNLARANAEAGNHGAAWRTLRSALPYAWRYPRWWMGALKRILRLVLPARRRVHQ